MKKDIFVIGHKNPDTDSICSAIAFADLGNQVGDGNYIASRAGELNPETEYVLDYFGVEKPTLLEDARAQIKDCDYSNGRTIAKETTLKEAWKLLLDKSTTTLTVLDENKHIIGIISATDIAKAFMGAYDNDILGEAKTSYKNIVDTLEATVVVGDIKKSFENGKVVVGTVNSERLKTIVAPGDLVVLADKEGAQRAAIEAGASCLVVCLGAPVEESVKALAKEKGCIIISSLFDSFITTKLLNQSMPVSEFMIKGKIITFAEDEFIDDVKATISEVRFREFPVTDKEGKFKGILTRNDLINITKKHVVMVDHNEENQGANGIYNAEIMGIVDHHKLGHITTVSPVFYKNMPVGSTATIVYSLFKESDKKFSKKIAGMLCSAILSDTLLFRSPTCTPLDKEAVEELAKIAEIDPEKYALDMFAAGSDFGSKTEKEIFYLDYKKFNVGDVSYGVGQVSSVNKKELDDMKDKLFAFMEEFVESSDVAMVYLMLTDILSESSELLCAGAGALDTATRAFGVKAENNSVYLEGAVSRKKQIVPQLTAELSN